MWRELLVVAAVAIAVIVRGWPRRRRDRWSVTFKIERDRGDGEDPPPPS